MKKLSFTILFVLGALLGVMAQSIVSNSGFDTDNAGWFSFSNDANSAQIFDNVADADFTGNCAHIKVSAGSADRTDLGNAWKLGIRYNVSFPKDAHYKIKFRAKASADVKLQAMFQENFPDYASWGVTEFDLTTTVQDFETDITADHNVGGIWSFVFYYGHLQTDDEIWIDDIEVIQIAGGSNIVAGDFETDVKNLENHVPGWGLSNADLADANMTLDSNNPISGSNSLLIESVESSVDGWRIFARRWCYPTIGKRYWLRFKAKATTDVSDMVVEFLDDWPDRNNTLFYHTYDVGTEVKEYNFVGTSGTTEFDKYNLNFWTAMVPAGEKIWLDDIELFPFYYVTGIITDTYGDPFPGVTVVEGVQTDDDGFYAIFVPESEDVTITPALDGYDFDPPTYTFSNMWGDSVMNFTASESVNIQKKERITMKVYPNPVTDMLQISLGDNDQSGSAIIYDLTGRLILERELYNSQNTIDLRTLNNGVYIVNIVNSRKQQEILRIVKQ